MKGCILSPCALLAVLTGVLPAMLQCDVKLNSGSSSSGDQLDEIRAYATLFALRNNQVWFTTGDEYCYSSPGSDCISGYCKTHPPDSLLIALIDSMAVRKYQYSGYPPIEIETVGFGPFYTPDSACYAVRTWCDYQGESDSTRDHAGMCVQIYTAEGGLVFELDEHGPEGYADTVFWRFF